MSRLSEGVARFFDRHPSLRALFREAEDAAKKPLFGCQSCGQCALSSNAMVCCMRCPKQLRNGPCGGTREDGHCEVYPERVCIWWLIYSRSRRWRCVGRLRKFHRPLDRRLQDTAAWLNMFAGRIDPLDFSKDIKPGDDLPHLDPDPPKRP